MKTYVAVVVTAAGLVAATAAQAQSSVTLYGIIDTGLAYQNSSGTLGQTSGATRR
ncbi:hypothetical protein B7760_04661 [Burkholderia glumae]|nr:hypothetical protein B7760_04661 [Burkholderia glumae]